MSIKCNCRLDYNDNFRLTTLEGAASLGNLEQVKNALAHIESYDYQKNPDDLFKRVKQRLNQPITTKARENRDIILQEIDKTQKAMLAYNARMNKGIPSRLFHSNR